MMIEEKNRAITLRQLLYYFADDEEIQICSDGWNDVITFRASSWMLEPFKDRRIICLGAEDDMIRVEIVKEG